MDRKKRLLWAIGSGLLVFVIGFGGSAAARTVALRRGGVPGQRYGYRGIGPRQPGPGR